MDIDEANDLTSGIRHGGQKVTSPSAVQKALVKIH